MSEQSPHLPQPITEMTYADFVLAQEHLRSNTRPTIPYINMSSRPGYSAAEDMVGLLKTYNLEGNSNIALGGVTIFVDNETDFTNMQRFINEQNISVELPPL